MYFCDFCRTTLPQLHNTLIEQSLTFVLFRYKLLHNCNIVADTVTIIQSDKQNSNCCSMYILSSCVVASLWHKNKITGVYVQWNLYIRQIEKKKFRGTVEYMTASCFITVV